MRPDALCANDSSLVVYVLASRALVTDSHRVNSCQAYLCGYVTKSIDEDYEDDVENADDEDVYDDVCDDDDDDDDDEWEREGVGGDDDGDDDDDDADHDDDEVMVVLVVVGLGVSAGAAGGVCRCR